MPRDRLGQKLSILKSLALGVPVTTILLFFFRVVRYMLKKEQIRLGRMLIISAFTSVKVVEQLCKKDRRIIHTARMKCFLCWDEAH